MLTGYLRQRRRALLAFFLFGGIFAAAFALYQLPLRAVAYPFVLCAAAGAVLLTLDYRRVLRQHRRLELLRQLPEELADALPPADTVTEADYRSLVTLLAESRRAIRTQEEQRYGDMVDYYTMWAHQIKTPIASMRLTLQNEDSGMGIAPEDLPRIFDRGFTGLNGRRDTRASGIGLYLCRRICRSLGHTIRASSVPNQGTEIRIGLGQKKTLPE